MDWYRRRPLLWWAGCIVLGILLAQVLPAWTITCIAVLAVGLGLRVVLASFTGSGKYITFIFLVIICLGSYRYFGNANAPNPLLAGLADQSIQVMYTGVVSEVDSTSNGTPYCETVPLALYNNSISAHPVQAWIPKSARVPVPGDTLTGLGSFSRYPRARNPGEFDYRRYQQRNHRYFQLNIQYPWHLEIKPGSPDAWQNLIRLSRIRISGILHYAMTPQSAHFASALILGSRDAVREELVNTYSSLGIIHVMAVSGLHVGFVTLILLVVAQVVRLPFRYQILFAILGLAFYAALVDFRPSVVRASIMAGVFLAAEVTEKRYDILNLLGFAAVIILLVDPGELFQLGFQLSFVAVLSIVLLYSRIESRLERTGVSVREAPKIIQYFSGLLLVSFAAFIGTVPLTTYHFGMLPLWGILVNLVVIPVIGLVVISSFVVILTSLVWAPLGKLYAEFPDLLIRWMNSLLPVLEREGLGAMQIPDYHWGVVFLVYGVLAAILGWRYDITKRVVLFGGLISVNLWLVLYPGDKKNVRVTFLDVGQGDAAVIELPDETTLLVDAGIRTTSGDRGQEVVVPYLNRRGISDVDIAVLSHPHNDHVGGFPWILRHFRVREIWDTHHTYSTKVMGEIRSLADSQRTVYRQISAGFDTLIQGARFTTFFPMSKNLTENINNHSIVQKMEFGQTSVLWTGDIEHEVDPYILHYDTLLRADLLKVPHHGSITSSTLPLIKAIDPKYAVVSVGEGNKFDHPSEVVLDRYRTSGISPILTMETGAVVFESDRKKWTRIDWRND